MAIHRNADRRVARNLQGQLLAFVLLGSVLPAFAQIATPVVADNEFHFVVLGDSQFHDPAGFNRIVDDVKLLHPAFVLQVGDMIRGYSDDLLKIRGEWNRFQLQIAPLAPIAFMPVPGNHDLYNASSKSSVAVEKIYREYWGATFYSFDYQNSLFVVLNTDGPEEENRIGPEQWAWLKKTLNASAALHMFLFMHRPPHTLDNAEALHELLREHRVRYVFYGHHHHYHFDERDGIRYVMTNAAANSALSQASVGSFDHLLHVSVRDSTTGLAVVRADAIENPEFVHPSDNYDLFNISRELIARKIPLVEVAEGDGRFRWKMPLPLKNPTQRPLDLFIQCKSNDDRWQFSPQTIEPVRLSTETSTIVQLEVSYTRERQPESSPVCLIRIPFQKRNGEWLDYTIEVEGQLDR
jgi:predicted phosphodiesterase